MPTYNIRQLDSWLAEHNINCVDFIRWCSYTQRHDDLNNQLADDYLDFAKRNKTLRQQYYQQQPSDVETTCQCAVIRAILLNNGLDCYHCLAKQNYNAFRRKWDPIFAPTHDPGWCHGIESPTLNIPYQLRRFTPDSVEFEHAISECRNARLFGNIITIPEESDDDENITETFPSQEDYWYGQTTNQYEN